MDKQTALGFTGAYLDSLTAAYPLGNGYRWYLPDLMRFNAPDELSPFGEGGPNPYAYCADDPVNCTDPTGHAWLRQFLGLSRRTVALEDEPHNVAHAAPTGASITEEQASGQTHALVRRGEADDHAVESVVSDPPPAYSQLRPPTYRKSFVEPIYLRIQDDMSALDRNMSDELVRIYGEDGSRSSTPSPLRLVATYFTNRRRWRVMIRQQTDELAIRANNLIDYRDRLHDIERKINRSVNGRPLLDDDLQRLATKRYRKLKKVYKQLAR